MDEITPIAPTRKSLILIVDDIPKNLQVLGNILQENDYEIALAKSGRQAAALTAFAAPSIRR